jgi:hypothetical protein
MAMAGLSVTLEAHEERALQELASDMGLERAEVMRRALRLLGIVYGLHASVHGVVSPVRDPRAEV